jgi:CheY-like chemotaxis protein
VTDRTDLPSGEVRTFRLPVARAVGLWTAGVLTFLGAAAIGVTATLLPGQHSAAQLTVAAAGWLGLTAVASAVLAWRLSGLLAAPGDTLLTLLQIDGGAVPAKRRSLAEAYGHLNDRLVRGAHEKNGRVNELVRARENARVQGEALARFSAGMSHELRTPLNAIMGYATLLAEDAADTGQETQVRDLHRILDSSRQLLGLINDILDLTRLDAGEVVIDRAVVDIPVMIKAITDGVAGDAARCEVTIETDIAPNARIMLGDAARLRQCLGTLLGRLVESHRGGKIKVGVSVTGDADPRVQFRLTDPNGDVAAAACAALDVELANAQGAPPAPLAAAVRAMTVARRLAALMGGSLITESAPEGGQVFILSLPLSTGEPARDRFAQPLTLAPTPQADSGVRTVLVIDDDGPTVDLFDRWLSGEGYRVIEATNGPAGLALARAQTPDFIILDVVMPGQSGYEVLAEIKADPALRHIPVIIVSSDDNRKLGLELGAAEVMVKPISRPDLAHVLDVLDRKVVGDLLVVDDDEDTREIVQRYASQAGLTVRVASNGGEGMALARASTPGAIVLDLCMPGSDGFAMIDALSKEPALARVPVMVLSQLNISVAEHTRIREAGYDFRPKWKSSPSQIVEGIKSMVAAR